MSDAIREEKCEDVWVDIINVRGESMTRTVAALCAAGFQAEAHVLHAVATDKAARECYARKTFLAHARLYPSGKLRFLQYVSAHSHSWWAARESIGAISLGRVASLPIAQR